MLLPKVFAVPKDVFYFYDQFPLAAADFSLRKKRVGHTQAVRVRAASGTNAGNDKIIGFDSNGELNITALENWCDGGDGFVNKWFDATGNGNHVFQTTASFQPKIVSAGSVVKENGRPALDFDGSDDFLKNNSFSSFMEGEDKVISTFVVEKLDSTGTTQNSFAFENSSDDRPLYLKRLRGSQDNTPQYIKRDDSGILKQTDLSTGTDTNQHLQTGIIESTGKLLNIYEDGSALKTDFDIDVGTLTLDLFTIGAERRATNTAFFDGKMQELIIYPSDQSANRTVIESDINGYFSIY